MLQIVPPGATVLPPRICVTSFPESSSSSNMSPPDILPEPNTSTTPTAVNVDKSLVDMGWFWGEISREEVTEKLEGTSNGTFLVRNSSTPGDYTISLRQDGSNKLIKIYQRDGKYGFSPTDQLHFSSVVDLVEFYKTHSLKHYNRNLDLMLTTPVTRNESYGNVDDEEFGVDGLETLKKKLTQSHCEYLKTSKEYDVWYENYTKLSHELLCKRQALAAFQQSLTMFHEQIELHKKFCIEAQTHEQQRLRENLDILLSRCDSLLDCKCKMEDELQMSVKQHQYYERELNLIKPDLIRLYRRRDKVQKAVIKRGCNVDIVQKLLDDAKNSSSIECGDEKQQWRTCADIARSSSSKSGGIAAPKASDYIPPDGALQDTKNYLLEGRTKQEAMALLAAKRDGTFLIRASETRPGFFALSLVCRNRVHNCLLECRHDDGKYGFAGAESWFGSLVELVQYYSYNSLKDHNSELDTTLMHPVMLEPQQQQKHS